MAVFSPRRLPPELVIQIAGYLDTQTCATLLRSCHQYAALLTHILHDPHLEYYDFLPPDPPMGTPWHPKYAALVTQVTKYMDRWKSPSILNYFRNLPKQHVNREFTGIYQGTLLHGAVSSGNLELTTILIEKGADVNSLGGMCRTPLSYTIRNGREGMIRLLIRHGADPLIQLQSGVPRFLTNAVTTGSASLVRFCLEIAQEAGFNFDPGSRASGILLCRGTNHPQVVELFLGMGVSPLAESEHRDTALNIAASRGNVNSCRILYEAAVPILHGDLQPLARALETAIDRNDLEVIKCFIDRRIDILDPAPNRDYKNPLEHALKEGRKSIVEAMLASRPELWKSDIIQNVFKAYMEVHWRFWQAQAPRASFLGLILDLNQSGNAALDLNIRGWGGHTLLHRFALIDFENRSDDIAVLHRLIDEPSTDLTRRNWVGDTPLHVATRGHNCVISELLLSTCLTRAPEAINLQNKKGKTPLHLALEAVGPLYHDYGGESWEEFLNHLIDAGVHLDICDEDGQSPLHIAAAHHHSMAFRLVEKGVALGLRDSSGRTAFLIALEHYGVNVACYMLSKSPELLKDINNSPARLIRMSCNGEYLAYLFGTGVDATIRESDGGTLLHTAVEFGNSQCIEVIISRHPELIHATNAKGLTPLHLMSNVPCRVNVIRKLLDAGADLSFRDQGGRTILYNTIDHGNLGFMKLIISREPNLAVVPNEDGDTPLHLAARLSRCRGILERLLEANIDINVRDFKGRTPLHAAASGGAGNSYDLLLQKVADPTLFDTGGMLASDLLRLT